MLTLGGRRHISRTCEKNTNYDRPPLRVDNEAHLQNLCRNSIISALRPETAHSRVINNLSPCTHTIDCTLKKLLGEAGVCTFNAQKSKRYRRFQQMNLEILQTCSICPCQTTTYCCFFDDENLGSLKSHTSQRNNKT